MKRLLLLCLLIFLNCKKDSKELPTESPTETEIEAKEFKINNFINYTPENSGLPDIPIYSIKFDNLNRAWIGTDSVLTSPD
jgi:hypothetical protein